MFRTFVKMKGLLFSALLFSCLVQNVWSQPTDDPKISTALKFAEILNYVESYYVDSVNPQKLTETAVVALLKELDPHSTYISKEEVAEANSTINGSFVGIGVRFQIIKDTILVVATIPGGPSEKMGLMAGDKIVSVDDQHVAGIGIKNDDVRSKLMGELGTKVKVGINRKNVQKQLDFVITRDKIAIHSVDAFYMVTPEIGYIKLNSFSRTSGEEVQKALKELIGKGMKHLVFDLQDNGGGLLDAARYLGDEFLSGEKLIVYSEGRSQPRSELRAARKGLWEKGSLVMLVDENTASASEILSGAVQDWDRGLVIGRRSFGKGLVQRPLDLADGSQIRLTIARYYTPTGRFIQKPYEEGAEDYEKDILNRYKNGEFQSLDSLKLPDSLRKQTLLMRRTVHGGGGIVPDIFVPLDTTTSTDFFLDLIRTGHVNTFTIEYTDKYRKKLKEKHPTFESFKKGFFVDKAFYNEFFKYVEKEDTAWKMNQKEFEISEKDLSLRLKAEIAENLFGLPQYYEIVNETNDMLLKAIEVISNGQYKEAELYEEN